MKNPVPTASIKLKYVYYARKRGKWRARFEKPGQPKHWMKSKPDSMELIAEWQALMDSRPTPKKSIYVPNGSFAWLVGQYRQSLEWSELAPRTKTQRLYFYNGLIDQAPRAGALISPSKVRQLRDNRAGTPGAARNFMKALSALYKWAVSAGHVDSNPVDGVARPRQSRTGHAPWTIEDVKAFRERWPIGTKEHLALCLFLFTACRRSDVVTLGRMNARAGWLSWVMVKNSDARPQRIEVPILPQLQEAITAAGVENQRTYLVTEYGRPHSVNGFGSWWRKRCDLAGIEGKSAHGLRKAAGAILADHGCTEHQIMAVLGHMNARTSEIYTRSASRRLLAQEAMAKMAKMDW